MKVWAIIFHLCINVNLIQSTLVIGPSNATFNIPVNITIPNEEISICLSLKFEGPVHNTRLFGNFPDDFCFWLRFDFGFGWFTIQKSYFIYVMPEDHGILPFTWTKLCFSTNATHYHVVNQGKLWYQSQRNQIQNLKGKTLKGLHFEETHHFFSKLQMWSTFQTPTQLMESSLNCEASQADLLDWNDLNEPLETQNDLLILDQKENEICFTLSQKIVNPFTAKLSFEESQNACQKLGGQLHFPGWMYEDYTDLPFSNSEQCPSKFYWIPLKKLDAKEYLMVNDNKTLEFSKDWPWTIPNNAPNGGLVQKCIAVTKLGIDDLICELGTCFFCEFHKNVLFNLRGLCENSMIDYQYVMKPSNTYNDFVTFQGFQQSFIRKEGNNWQIINIENGDKEMVLGELDARLLHADQLPTGKVWKYIGSNHTTSTSFCHSCRGYGIFFSYT